ncbi:MAG: hypothetical protein HOF90_03550 [Euryarchaeota archaeon]|nr:hypothetical protein [Euryarchaeota archaeon]
MSDRPRLLAISLVILFVLSTSSMMGLQFVDQTPSISGESDTEDIQYRNGRSDLNLNPAQEAAFSATGLGRSSITAWAASGGSEGDDTIYEMAFDSQGNVLLCGSIFVDSLFGTIQVYSEGLGDILVAKMDSNGTWLWAATAGTATAWDECRGLYVDKNDDVYASGYILGTVAFGPNYTLEPQAYDGYVARLNGSTGVWEWAMRYGGFDVDVGWDLLVDDNLDIYVTGYFQNTTEFGSTVLGGGTQPSEDPRLFVAKYNTSVEMWNWAKTSTGNGLASSFQMAFDQNGDIYVVGYNTGSESWNGNFTSTAQGTWAGVLLKYDTDGNLIWGRSVGSPSCPFGIQSCGVYFNNIVVDSQNRVVLGGNFLYHAELNGQMYYGSGNWDILIVRYLSDGTFDWSARAGGANDDRIQALTVNPNDEVIVGGYYLGWIKSTPNKWNVSSGSGTYYEAFVANLDSNGNWAWAASFGGGANDSTEALLAFSDGSLLAGGYFSGSYTFGNQQHYATDEDVFVWRFQWDSDDDGVHDYTDNCDFTQNANQSDFDNDTMGDACETDDDNDLLHDVLDDCQYGDIGWDSTNLTLDHDEDGCRDAGEDTDDDNDGILDIDDLCTPGELDWISSNLTDQDGDGCQDNSEDFDDDADGIEDLVDNCAIVYNPLQENYDSDIFGDICDLDDDDDQVNDVDDNCPMNETNWTSNGATDNDADGCQDSSEDLDDDNDGMLDLDGDDCPSGNIGWLVSEETDLDWDGCQNDSEDIDNDNDGLINSEDDCNMGFTNWTRDSNTDQDGDGCNDDIEDLDDDNDNFPDVEDDCPNVAGSSYLGGAKGCSDDDEDGWGDTSDAFPFDGTQWDDGDEDGYGDNPFGSYPDSCPLIGGNSSADRYGCLDSDGDSYSDPDVNWGVFDGADALPFVYDQQVDADGDGFGDKYLNNAGNLAEMADFCEFVTGTSTIDRQGCLDSDGDGYSDPDNFWVYEDGADHPSYVFDPTQWADTDGDGYGDNWADPTWNETRNESGIGQWIEGATKPDLCPTLENSYADTDGCPLGGIPVIDDGSDSENSSVEDEKDSSTPVLVYAAIGGGLLVVGLGVVVMMLLKPKAKEVRRSTKSNPDSTGGPAKAATGGDIGAKSYDTYLDESFSGDAEEIEGTEILSEQSDLVESAMEPKTVDSWEKLPSGGEYLDPDDSGTIWYLDTGGVHWFQNADESWTQYFNE